MNKKQVFQNKIMKYLIEQTNNYKNVMMMKKRFFYEDKKFVLNKTFDKYHKKFEI